MTDYIMKKKKTNYKRKRGPVQAKKVTYDGIKFASGLERYMYQALKKAKIKAAYEGATFEIVEDFMFDNASYERTANGKGEFKQRGRKKILPIKYTPDFICPNYSFIIECKGRANESFPLRWKLFKKYVVKNYPDTILFKPQNHPHNDPEDPTANDCNYNFAQMLFAFCLGATVMFVLAVDEINDFKGCPLPPTSKSP